MPILRDTGAQTRRTRKPRVRVRSATVEDERSRSSKRAAPIRNRKPTVEDERSRSRARTAGRKLTIDERFDRAEEAAKRRSKNSKTKVDVNALGVLSPKDIVNAAKDIAYLPKTIVQGGYEVAAAGAEAVTGDTKRAKGLVKSFKEHDPFYLAATGKFDKASAELKAHPGLAVLEAYGGVGAVGRGTTRVQKRVGKDPTKRAPAKVPDSNLVQPRSYTNNAFQRGADKVRERQRIKASDQMRAEAQRLEKTDPAGSVGRVQKLRRDADRKDPRVASENYAKKRGARTAAMGRTVTQRNQAATAMAAREAIAPPKTGKLARVRPRRASEKPSAIQVLTARGIIDGTPKSMQLYRDRIAAKLSDDTIADYEKANIRAAMAEIDKSLKANPSGAQARAAAHSYKGVSQPLQQALVERKVLPGARAEKAPLVGPAVVHMPGVVPGPKGPMRPRTDADAAATPVAAARREARAADKAVVAAVAAHNKAVGRAQILTRNVDGVERTRAGYSGGSRAVKDTAAALVAARAAAKVAQKNRVNVEKSWKAGARARREASAGTKGYVRVTAPEIRAGVPGDMMRRTSFVSERPPKAKGGSRGGTVSPPKVDGATRTGRSSAIGTADISPQVLIDTPRNAQRLKDLADNYTSTVREAVHPNHMNLTRTKAERRAKELQAKNGIEYSVIPVDPFTHSQSLARTLDDADGPDSTMATEAIKEAVTDAYSGKTVSASGKYAVAPKAYVQELIDQANNKQPTGAIGTTMRGQNAMFRRAVLATSPTWFVGNALEGMLRAGIAGVRPGDKKLFNKILAELDKTDPRIAQELRARAAGGGHYMSVDMAARGSVLDGYHATSLERPARALQSFWEKPGAKGAADLWGKWTHIAFNQISGRMESSIQSSMAGAAIRHGQLMDSKAMRHTLRVNEQAVQQAARGLTNTNEQAALGEAVVRMYGRYDGFTADGRFYIANFTPFAAWALNAANFVLHVLPADHPTAVALAAAQEKATRDWRKEHKLDDLPGWLQGSIPMEGGKHQRVIRYTPFGFFTEAGANASNLVLPQFSGVKNALAYGMDWKGQKVYKDGHVIEGGDRALLALQSFSEATIPLYGKVKQAIVKGPGSLNPFKPISPPKAKPGAPAADSGGIDFSTYNGGGASGIDFSGYGGGP